MVFSKLIEAEISISRDLLSAPNPRDVKKTDSVCDPDQNALQRTLNFSAKTLKFEKSVAFRLGLRTPDALILSTGFIYT